MSLIQQAVDQYPPLDGFGVLQLLIHRILGINPHIRLDKGVELARRGESSLAESG